VENVLFNYVVDGVVVEGPFSYTEVLARTGLKDTVGFTEAGYIEILQPVEPPEVTKEQIQMGIRNMRNSLLQQCDWTQVADAPLNNATKALWTTYRQELRDLPETCADVDSLDSFYGIVWPTAPGTGV
jgi:hypothetical protein